MARKVKFLSSNLNPRTHKGDGENEFLKAVI